MNIRKRSVILSLLLSMLVGGVALVSAQTPSVTPSVEKADVLIDGRAILRVWGIKGAGADIRAKAISDRIIRFASDPYFNTASVTVVESDISSDIVSSDNILMSVFDKDAQAEGQSRQEIAGRYAVIIRAAIDQYRRAHSSRNLLKGALFALLATIVLVGALLLIQRLYRKIQSSLPIWTRTKIGPTFLKKYEIIDAEQVSATALGLTRFIRLIAVLVLFYFYLGLVFSFFPWTRNLAGGLLDFVIGPLETMGAALRNQVPKLIFIGILVFITRYVLKLMQVFFSGIEVGTIEISGFDRDWATPTYKIFRILAVAFAVTIAYPYIPGSESDAFKGISIFLGVLVSLGSSSLVSNVVGGLSLTYMRSFKVGDRVKIGDFTGDIVATLLQVTQIRTPKNEIVSLPNSSITSSHVMNYSALAREKGLILHTTVGIGYDVPWRQVRAMLLMAAEKADGVLSEPRPFVRQKSLGDFCVTYELNAYTDRPREMGNIYSTLHKNILDVFNEYGVQIMTPNYEGDREVPALVARENWYAAPADRFRDEDEEEGKMDG